MQAACFVLLLRIGNLGLQVAAGNALGSVGQQVEGPQVMCNNKVEDAD